MLSSSPTIACRGTQRVLRDWAGGARKLACLPCARPLPSLIACFHCSKSQPSAQLHAGSWESSRESLSWGWAWAPHPRPATDMGWRRLLKWLPKLKDILSVRHVLAKGRKSYGQTTDCGTGDTGQPLEGADPRALTPHAPALPHTLSRPHAPHCHTASLLREPRATLEQGPAFPQLLMGRLGSAGSPLPRPTLAGPPFFMEGRKL